ncbi:alpha-catulin-like [Oppia nitens]|uniref:alpha-catulin-like n=1 Tax=Oppia nitens TaxID=1686743 RepID=UPI0023D9F8C1|nr:alpha-catulin-like [Oppia nitens]
MQRRRNRITTLVNAREKPIKTEKQLKAIVRVGQSVNLSVERFVAVGEAIADDNPEIRAEMCDACKDARAAGTLIEQLCESATHEIDPSAAGQMRSYSDKSCMVRAARALLSSVTRVLLIADTVVVKQLISTKDRVSISLNRLENVANFTEFVKAFSQFGTEMVELAHLTGDRQNDLKDERRRAQMSCARQILERSTMMLLTSSKCCLRHPDCDTARDNRDTVFLQMRRAMDLIHMVVKDGVIPQLAASAATYETNMRRTGRHVSRYETRYQTPEWKLEEWDECITAYNAVRRLHDLIEMCRMTFVGQHIRDRLNCALAAVVERTQDFTDSAYTSHERRERILLLCDRARLELNSLLRNALCLEQSSSQSPSEDFEASITQTLRASIDLKNELQDTALDQIDELLKLEAHHQDMVGRLRNTALASDQERLDELCEQFNEYCERVQEVCRLLHHTSPTDTTQIKSKHLEMSLEVHGQQLIAACHTLAVHPNSKIAKENLDVFADVWHLLCGDLTQLAREVSEHVRGCPQLENSVYLPQQRYPTGTLPLSTAAAGTSTSTMRSTQPFGASQMTNPMNTGSPSMSKVMPNPNAAGNMSSRYSDEESKGKGQSSDTDMGTDVEGKASNAEDDNDIARKVKSMSTMATSMLQFTRGEGELKTTQDLFTQAEFFADEGNKLYKIVRHFSYQVPSGPPKKELLDNVDKVPTFVQQLQFAVKNVTVGKAATFTKVDNVIQETKNLMSVINLVAKNCANCANQYNLDMQGALRTRARTLSPSMRSEAEMFYDSSGGMGIKGGGLSGDPDI